MNKKKNNNETNLSESITELKKITEWFEKQNEIDIEESILKIKQGALLVKDCKAKLRDLENTFEEIKKELEAD